MISDRTISGRTIVAGVAGHPVTHSLSPLLHNSWLAEAGVDGVYVAFPLQAERFDAFANGLRGGAVRGLNVTLPFKERALALADDASEIARLSGAANVLVFEADGRVRAHNTDGEGLLAAFRSQAPAWSPDAGPVVVLGAGGAARGAVAALLLAGCPEIRVLNRTASRAETLAAAFSGEVVRAAGLETATAAFAGVTAVINATSAGLADTGALALPLDRTPEGAAIMDMVYKPLETPFLAQARALGRVTVDGLEMLIGQARPSFEMFFGAPAPPTDVRGLALAALAA